MGRTNPNRRELIDELANTLETGQNAYVVLDGIEFPRNRVPTRPETSRDFWERIVQEIESGLTPGGVDALVRAAHELYQYNPVFRSQSSEPPRAPVTQEAGGPSVAVRDCNDVLLVLDTARRLAEQNGLPGPVAAGYHSAGTFVMNLPDMTGEQAIHLAQLLQDDLHHRGYTSMRFSSATSEFRDYLIRSLYVEGPDQARFELTNIPASTPVRDIAQGVMDEYPQEKLAKDRSGRPLPTVVDHIREDGSQVRLDPDTSLHQNDIGENSHLHVARQSTAGINPQERDEALRRVYRQVLDYAEKNPGFAVRVDNYASPNEYLFNFRAPGWGPPDKEGDPPVEIDEHEIFLVMPSTFPMSAPEAYVQTPVFHPNVDPASGWVCFGALKDQYVPGKNFEEICKLLVEIVSWQNANLDEPLKAARAAYEWALSREGVIAIEVRGGRSFLRKLMASQTEPRPLEIRRQ